MYIMYFPFVFSYPGGTFLGPPAYWHSKLSLRRTFSFKRSVVPVNSREKSKGRRAWPENVRGLDPGGPPLLPTLGPSPPLGDPVLGKGFKS